MSLLRLYFYRVTCDFCDESINIGPVAQDPTWAQLRAELEDRQWSAEKPTSTFSDLRSIRCPDHTYAKQSADAPVEVPHA